MNENQIQENISVKNYVCERCGACDWQHKETVNDNRKGRLLMQKHIYRCGACKNELHETKFISQTLGGEAE
jgi:predicted SprT family Zn-dependent metalloprotease